MATPSMCPLQVEYCTGVSVELGNEVTPTDMRCQPQVTWVADPWAYYTLVMIGENGATEVGTRREIGWDASVKRCENQ